MRVRPNRVWSLGFLFGWGTVDLIDPMATGTCMTILYNGNEGHHLCYFFILFLIFIIFFISTGNSLSQSLSRVCVISNK